MEKIFKSPVGKVQPSPERLKLEMKYMEHRYDDVLGKVFEQNSLILSYVAVIQEDLKTLRAKFESLELSIKEAAAAPKANVNDGRLSGSLWNQSQGQAPASGLAGPALSSMPQQFQPPPQFYNPYMNPMCNPYMMMAASQMRYLMNPAMQHAAGLYGGLSQNPAETPTVEPLNPTIPPFPFGIPFPPPANDSLNMSNNSSVNLSFSSSKPPVAEPLKKFETGLGGVGLGPTELSDLDNANETTEVGSISTPKQLPTTTTTVTKVDTNPGTQAVTPPERVSGIRASAPVKLRAGRVVTSDAPASFTAAGIGLTGVSTSETLMSSTPTCAFPSKPPGATTLVTTTPIFAPPASTALGVPSMDMKPFTFGFFSSTSQFDGPIHSSALNSSKSVTAVFKDTETNKSDAAPAPAPTIDLAALSAKMRSFGFTDVKPTTTSASPFGESKDFGTVPDQVFATPTARSTEARPKAASTPSSSVGLLKSGHDKHQEEDDFVPTAEFAPVIPLPPLVEVKKGDENENILFQHRAKLLRFVKETKEWKERGVGDIKILQSKESLGKIRVVMWREKVHKIACNHWVTKELKITNYQGNANNLMWSAIDFAEVEEGPKPEIFVCRFGEQEQAKEFKKQMKLAVSLVLDRPITPEKGDGSKSEGKTEEAKPAKLAPLSEMFKTPEGQWRCEACYTDNKKESLACAGCTSPKPGASPADKPMEVVAPKFSFGFGSPTITPAVPMDLSAKVESESSFKSGTAPSNISFGFSSTTTTDKGQLDTNSNEMDTTPAPKPTTTRAPVLCFPKCSTDPPSFGSSGVVGPTAFGEVGEAWMDCSAQPVFEFPAQKPRDPANNASSATGGDEAMDDFVPTAEFVPVIPFPSLVEVKKGDENENVIFSNRAKLLRFVKKTNKWRERGVGNIKILQAKDQESKIRVVMWREKVHKILCNHWITGDLEVTNHEGKVTDLKWSALDFAEADVDGPKTEIFVCRFYGRKMAMEFKAQMEKAIAIVKSAAANDSLSTSNNSSVNLSFDSPMPPVAEPPKKAENVLGGVGLMPKELPALDNPNKAEVGSILTPKQLPATTTTVTKVDTKPAIRAMKPIQPIIIKIKGSNPVKPAAKTVVTVAPSTGMKPLTSGFSSTTSQVNRPIRSATRKSSKSVPAVSKGEKDTEAKESDPAPAPVPTTDFGTVPVQVFGSPKSQMEKAVSIMKTATTTPEKADENAVESMIVSSETPLLELFKKLEGEWTCNACDVSNIEERTSCLSCNTSQPGSAAVIQSDPPPRGEVKILDLTVKDSPKVPVVEDNSKPERPEGSETLKDELTHTTESNETNTGGTAPPAAPTFDFKPPFNSPPNKNPVDNLNVPTTIATYDGDEDEEWEDLDDVYEDDTKFFSEGVVAHYKNKSDDPDFTDHGEGQVKILYDRDHFCARFVFVPSKDDKALNIDHVIAAVTQIQSTGENTFEWDCIPDNGDSPYKGRVKVTFPDQQAFDSFACAMSDSMDIAMEAGVTEEKIFQTRGSSQTKVCYGTRN